MQIDIFSFCLGHMKVLAATYLEGTREQINFNDLDEGRFTERSGRTSGIEENEQNSQIG